MHTQRYGQQINPAHTRCLHITYAQQKYEFPSYTPWEKASFWHLLFGRHHKFCIYRHIYGSCHLMPGWTGHVGASWNQIHATSRNMHPSLVLMPDTSRYISGRHCQMHRRSYYITAKHCRMHATFRLVLPKSCQMLYEYYF